jgi:L-ascorbate metabolism protein UlaG (beta-lactamase superfamily)
VLIELDGVRLLTDPVLSHRIGPLVRIAPDVDADTVGRLDGVLLSHLHADHAHLATLRRFDRTVPVIAPRGAAGWLRGSRVEPVRELAVGAGDNVGPVRVTATPAAHDAKRRPLGPAADPIGFVARGSRSVYFAGDTDLFPEMVELRGTIDVALLPVWGWGTKLGPGHLDPERAAQAASLIHPGVAIPIHWGTFTPAWLGRPADPERPARLFAELAAARAPGVEVRVPVVGERIEL